MKMKNLLTAGALLLAGAISAGSASTQTFPDPKDEAKLYELAKQEGTVVWYNGAPSAAMQNIANAFMEKYPGVTVEVIRLANLQQYQRFTQESAAGQNVADLVSLDFVSIGSLIKDGLLAEWTVPDADKLTPKARMGSSAYSLYYQDAAILYNPNKLTPEEIEKLRGNWEAVLDPVFKGRIAVTDQRCATCYTLTHMFMDPKLKDRFGPEFIKALATQQPSVYSEINIAIDRIVTGEKDLLISVWENAASAKWEEGAPVQWTHPSPSPLGLITAWSAISAKAPHPNAARLFQNWWVSEAGGTVAQQKFYGGPTTFPTAVDARAVVKQPWYDPITERYEIDPARWQTNFGQDMDFWINTLKGAK
ncbi:MULTISPECIES: extracellular solute-binding protein [unclassified Chelatococcus]|uniref:ABC transporter substrate-binding protein n=1 Tax=unclassified Chelatococcus TaxID=2638111 RepID=UPI001BCDBB33|nr:MULTISPECIES: extracellular solute-binding protein [unclassified Chelatococcus]MBS7701550.1 extracellular solute-binding protein [Chelatococcus sp. YT9]MBX3557385.1 extracellular solute-binding protein [Chelatococcus sp.]